MGQARVFPRLGERRLTQEAGGAGGGGGGGSDRCVTKINVKVREMELFL